MGYPHFRKPPRRADFIGCTWTAGPWSAKDLEANCTWPFFLLSFTSLRKKVAFRTNLDQFYMLKLCEIQFFRVQLGSSSWDNCLKFRRRQTGSKATGVHGEMQRLLVTWLVADAELLSDEVLQDSTADGRCSALVVTPRACCLLQGTMGTTMSCPLFCSIG